MYRFIVPLLLGVGSACLAGPPAHPRPHKLYRLNPAGVTESSLASRTTVVRDHRFDPVRVYNVYTAQMEPTSSAGREAVLLIRYSDGVEYDGRDAYGTIRNVGLGLCLTNPQTYTGNADRSELKWEACQPNTAGIPYRRQLFLIAKNAHNLVRVQSDLQYVLQVPNAKSECVERITPTEVKLIACNNLNNWMLTR